jgi:thiol-disulfide isomerase/thioredoxin
MRTHLLFLIVLLIETAVQAGPVNDNFVHAITIVATNTVVLGDNDYATKEPGEPDHADNVGGKSVWWTWQAPGTGYVSLSTAGSISSFYSGDPLDTLLGVYVGTSVSTLTEIASNDEDPTLSFTSRLGFKTSPGTIYRIAVDGYTFDTAADADSGSIQLSLVYSSLATNDDFANATILTGTNVLVTGNNDCATKEPGEPDHAGETGGKSVWWSWQAPATGYVTISTVGSLDSQTGSSLDAILAVYLGDSVSNLTAVAGEEAYGANATFRVDAGKTYRIVVDGPAYDTPSDAPSGSIILSLKFSNGLPLAPAWGPIPDIFGNMVSSTDFAGQVVVLNFWATWCPPCVGEIPDLVALYQKYAPDGLVIVGLSVDLSTDNVNPPTPLVSSFASANGMNYPVLMDRPFLWGIENSYGGIAFIPDTFIIDRQNHICQQFVGQQTYATFERTVLPLLYANLAVNLSLADGQAHFSWPVTQATFGIESTTNLQAGNWTPVSALIQSDGVNQFADLPIDGGRRFFRLRKQ